MAENKVTLKALAALITRIATTADKKFTALAGDIADLKTELMDQFEHVDKQIPRERRAAPRHLFRANRHPPPHRAAGGAGRK